APGGVVGDEGGDHASLELVGEVEDVVREAEAVGDRARVVEVVEGAAASAAARREAKRDADHLVARGSAARGRDRAVHPAAHGDDDSAPSTHGTRPPLLRAPARPAPAAARGRGRCRPRWWTAPRSRVSSPAPPPGRAPSRAARARAPPPRRRTPSRATPPRPPGRHRRGGPAPPPPG